MRAPSSRAPPNLSYIICRPEVDSPVYNTYLVPRPYNTVIVRNILSHDSRPLFSDLLVNVEINSRINYTPAVRHHHITESFDVCPDIDVPINRKRNLCQSKIPRTVFFLTDRQSTHLVTPPPLSHFCYHPSPCQHPQPPTTPSS